MAKNGINNGLSLFFAGCLLVNATAFFHKETPHIHPEQYDTKTIKPAPQH